MRIDTGVREGDAVTPLYDPMIAKVIAHGRPREEALDRLADALGQHGGGGAADECGVPAGACRRAGVPGRHVRHGLHRAEPRRTRSRGAGEPDAAAAAAGAGSSSGRSDADRRPRWRARAGAVAVGAARMVSSSRAAGRPGLALLVEGEAGRGWPELRGTALAVNAAGGEPRRTTRRLRIVETEDGLLVLAMAARPRSGRSITSTAVMRRTTAAGW